jgi:hypothetical protein
MTDKPDKPDDANNSVNFLVLLVVVLLVAGTLFLLFKLKQGVALENCLAQGRHDCQPINVPDQ